MPRVVVSQHPSGLPHVRDTLRKMAEQAHAAAHTYPIRHWATEVTHHVPSKSPLRELQALYMWVRDNIRFRNDPHKLEWLQGPLRTLKEKAGDCDCITQLLSAGAETLGRPVRYGVRLAGDGHVWMEAQLPDGRWIPMDPVIEPAQATTAPRADIGMFGKTVPRVGKWMYFDHEGREMSLNGPVSPRDAKLWGYGVPFFPQLEPVTYPSTRGMGGKVPTPDPRYAPEQTKIISLPGGMTPASYNKDMWSPYNGNFALGECDGELGVVLEIASTASKVAEFAPKIIAIGKKIVDGFKSVFGIKSAAEKRAIRTRAAKKWLDQMRPYGVFVYLVPEVREQAAEVGAPIPPREQLLFLLAKANIPAPGPRKADFSLWARHLRATMEKRREARSAAPRPATPKQAALMAQLQQIKAALDAAKTPLERANLKKFFAALKGKSPAEQQKMIAYVKALAAAQAKKGLPTAVALPAEEAANKRARFLQALQGKTPAEQAKMVAYVKAIEARRAQAAGAPPAEAAVIAESIAEVPAGLPVVLSRPQPSIHTPDAARGLKYPRDARSLFDEFIRRYRIFLPIPMTLGAAPTFTVSFGQADPRLLANLARAANDAVLQHIRSRADKRPPGRGVEAVGAFQSAEAQSRPGDPGALKVDKLWGNSSRDAAAHYMGIQPEQTARTAFRGASTWVAPAAPERQLQVLRREEPVKYGTDPSSYTPLDLTPVPTDAFPEPTPGAAIVISTPTTREPVPQPIPTPTPTPTPGPTTAEKNAWLAATATYNYFNTQGANFGTKNNRNEKLKHWERFMGLEVTGVYGPNIRNRVKELIGKMPPARPRTGQSQTIVIDSPEPTPLPGHAAPTKEPSAKQLMEWAGTQPLPDKAATPKVDQYIKATPETPPRGATYRENGELKVVGMQEVGQEDQNPGIPPVGVATSASAPAAQAAAEETAGPTGTNFWGWLAVGYLLTRRAA